MREPFRLVCAVIIGSAMALFGLAGVAIATPANTLDSNVAESDPYLTFRGIVKVKCPVVNLRNEATGEYIWGSPAIRKLQQLKMLIINSPAKKAVVLN